MIKYGISELSIISVRKEPGNQSEMTNQILFGETFQIIEDTNKWSYVKITFDSYEGWIDSNSITELSEDLFNHINSNPCTVTQNLSNIIINDKNEQIILPMGSTLPNFNKDNKTFIINKNQYQLHERYNDDKPDIVNLSKQFLNSPYLWGGKNPFGIDCSGFVQVVFKVTGKKLPRDANQQVNLGNTVNFISDTKPGDLAFFDDDEGNIIHVGIILNNNEIIHAYGKVRIDKLDQQGIYNLDLKKYTHELRVIKRIK